MKKGRKKFIDWQKKAHREKIIITILIFTIVLLTLAFGYDMYVSFETKAETDFLNGAVILLNKEKSQLILEQEDLNQTIASLSQQKDQLNTENNGLTLDLNELQEDHDALEEELAGVQDDLEDCEDDLTACAG